MQTSRNEHHEPSNDLPLDTARPKIQKTAFSWIALIVLLVVLITPDFFVDLPDLTSFVSVAIAASGMAQLLLIAPPYVLPLTALLCYARGLYLTASPLYAFGYFVPLPFAFALFLVMKKKLNRATAIYLFALLTAAVVLLTMVGQVCAITGTFSLSAAKTVFSPFVQTLREFLSTSFSVTIAGRELPYFNNETADAMIHLTFALFPGLLSAVLLTVGFLSSYFYRFLLGIFFSRRPDPAAWRVTPSLVSAIYFLLILLLCVVLPEDSILWLAAMNIILCLLPLFLIAGFGGAFGIRFVNGLPRPLLLRPTLLLIALLNGVFLPIALLVLFGLFDTVKAAVLKRKSSDDPPIS